MTTTATTHTAASIAAHLAVHGAISWSEFMTPCFRDQDVFRAAEQVLAEGATGLTFEINVRGKGERIKRTLALKPVVGMGATKLGWTDRHPYEIVAVHPKRLLVRAMNAVGGLRKDATVIPGGFVAHVVDQHSAQDWVITSNPAAPLVVIRKHKDGCWYSAGGEKFAVGYASKFHDYNF